MNPSGRSVRRAEWLWVILASIVKLWIGNARDLMAIGWAKVDDYWFLEKADSILRGAWLGPFDERTLIKGAGYPLFIAFTKTLSLPLLFAHQLFYTAACIVTIAALRPAIRSPRWRIAIFTLLLFNPICWSEDVGDRVLREAIYPSLSLLVLAGFAGAFLRREERTARIAPWVLVAAFSLAMFWHTREEGVWLLPALAALIGALLWAAWKAPDLRRKTVLIIGIPLLLFAGSTIAIVAANGSRYGLVTTVEFKDSSFVRAYASLIAVRQHPPLVRVPVPTETRERIYAVSPAFAELRRFLEGPIGKHWVEETPTDHHGEMGDGTFMWAFRDAVAAAGYYARGGKAVAAYYERIAKEIDAARVSKRLDARKARGSMAPPLLWGQRSEIATTFLRGLVHLSRFDSFWIRQPFSSGSDEELDYFATMTSSRVAPLRLEQPCVHLTGSARDAEGPLDVDVRRTNGTRSYGAIVNRDPAGHFDLWAPAHDSWLVLSKHGRPIDRIEVTYDAHLASRVPGVQVSLESMSVGSEPEGTYPVDGVRFALMKGIGRIYQFAFPIALLAALGLYFAGIRRSGAYAELHVVIAGVAAAIAARTLLLAAIQVTSMEMFLGRYECPGHAFLILLAGLMGYIGTERMRERGIPKTRSC